MTKDVKDTNYFVDLNSVNVKDKVEQKNGLTYLSWAWSWAEVCKRYPSATYEVVKFNGLPYVFDPDTGYMVYTKVTIEDITREMWLPVMDGNNLAMRNICYEVQTKYKKITVKPATMFDINKAIMRCLTKNLAMFGLGLYIYAGEDLPEGEAEAKPESKDNTPAPATVTAKPISVRKELVDFCNENDFPINDIAKMFKLNNSAPDEAFSKALEYCKTQAKIKVYQEAKAGAPSPETDDPLESAANFLNGLVDDNGMEEV